MPCIMQKIESGLLTFIVFKMLGKTKKPSQLIGKSEKVQIHVNEWMNEKHVEAKVGRNFKAVCWHNWLDTCVTDVISLQPLYTLLLCSLWSFSFTFIIGAIAEERVFLYRSQLDSFLSICSFSPPKNQWHEMFALHANIAGYRILWQISYPARSTTQNMN